MKVCFYFLQLELDLTANIHVDEVYKWKLLPFHENATIKMGYILFITVQTIKLRNLDVKKQLHSLKVTKLQVWSLCYVKNCEFGPICFDFF